VEGSAADLGEAKFTVLTLALWDPIIVPVVVAVPVRRRTQHDPIFLSVQRCKEFFSSKEEADKC
jgi:hypothetical protein